jgi:hypothetical protein
MCIINYVYLYLYDKDKRTFKYYIHTSLDGKNFVIAADNTKEFCTGEQICKFKTRAAKFVRVVGTETTSQYKNLYIHTLQALLK